MAAAALAYKCMEVAYMRVVYCKSPSTNRDRHDLQASLQMVPQGMIMRGSILMIDIHLFPDLFNRDSLFLYYAWIVFKYVTAFQDGNFKRDWL